ncbi:hypothetical protein [Clostridium sp.]|uniref:hypothetical protein n=1 Tax=Clostridium sp. TaxID=1506 RepID=UPI00321799B1
MRNRTTKKLGLIVSSIGVGIVLSMLIPFWGWMIVVGCAVIALGWFIMEKFC